MEDVKGGFNVLGQEMLDVVAGSVAERIWQFDVEWDGKVRGHGSANVGVAVIPGGIPHLDGANMEEKIREKAGAGA